jgi:group I intron endonuclease
MDSRYYIYRITNKISGKCYIGKAKDYSKRWLEHKRNVKDGKQHPLYDAIRKYGLENFLFEVLLETVENLVDKQEKTIIKMLSKYPLGYNLAEGGTGGDTTKHWDERRWEEHYKKHNKKNYRIKRISNLEIFKQIPGLLEKVEAGQITKKEAVKIRRAAGIYTEAELEGRQKIKKLHNTPEVKTLKSKNATGIANSRWLGYLQVFNTEGVLISEYETAKQAGKALNIPAHTIREKARSGEPYRCVKKTQEYYGYTFKFRSIEKKLE